MLGKIFTIGFERQYVRFDERARTEPYLLDFGRKGEIHTGAPS